MVENISPFVICSLEVMKYARFLVAFIVFGICSNAEALLITKQSSKKTIDVEPVRLVGGQFTFMFSGKQFTIAVNSLTKESQTAIASWQSKQAQTTASDGGEVNDSLGQKLFASGKSLWSENVADVADRLGWEKESSGKYSSSYRFFPHKSYGFANAHPYCCTLYGGKDKHPQSLSIVFANKGDFGSTVGFGEDHFKPKGYRPTPKSLYEAIVSDAKAISEELTRALGEPKKQRYGEKKDRRKVKRWDFDDAAFLLSEREGEYVHLLVVPTRVADKEGRVHFVKDQDFRKYLNGNVLKEENGDTRIINIPMVDQGPKGYCAPATFERAMRYMGVPADMYLLATLATSQGGGTNTGKLADEATRVIRSKARRIKNLRLDKDLKVRYVKRFIDKGVPLLWQMRSLRAYNEIANRRTKQRSKVEDFDQWAQEVAAEAEIKTQLLNKQSNHHICMIVGYNEKTNELAISDSWGASYELRWVHIDIAKAVTNYGGFVIDL